ncbi:MAG: hypothetical protein GY861_10780 [bacterium]|nr:hypothetical protein [bacterium]
MMNDMDTIDRVADLEEENEKLRMGLMWYACGCHEREADMTDPMSGYCFDDGQLAQSIIGEINGHSERSKHRREAYKYFLNNGTLRRIYSHLDWLMNKLDRYEARKENNEGNKE